MNQDTENELQIIGGLLKHPALLARIEIESDDFTHPLCGGSFAAMRAIIAAGSQAVRLPFMPDDPRVVDSTGALALQGVPQKMLIVGGGIVGMGESEDDRLRMLAELLALF